MILHFMLHTTCMFVTYRFCIFFYLWLRLCTPITRGVILLSLLPRSDRLSVVVWCWWHGDMLMRACHWKMPRFCYCSPRRAVLVLTLRAPMVDLLVERPDTADTGRDVAKTVSIGLQMSLRAVASDWYVCWSLHRWA